MLVLLVLVIVVGLLGLLLLLALLRLHVHINQHHFIMLGGKRGVVLPLQGR